MLELLLLGANTKPVEVSTSLLADKIGKSQQAASKHLQLLEREGFLNRNKSGKGNSIKFTKRGTDSVISLYSSLRNVLEKGPRTFEFNGQVFSGMKEGAYYVSLKGYTTQFIEKLGFNPYPGTLNIKLESETDRKMKQELEHYHCININGFEDKHRSYSPAKCFPAIIGHRIGGAVIIIERTHYDDSVLEILAPSKVRDELTIKDGDAVHIQVKIPEE